MASSIVSNLSLRGWSSRHKRFSLFLANYSSLKRINNPNIDSQHARNFYDKRLAFFRQKQATLKRSNTLQSISHSGQAIKSSDSVEAVSPTAPPHIQHDLETSKPMSDIESALKQLFQHETLVIQRHYEMLNIFFGYEQYNRYAITTLPKALDDAGLMQQSLLVGYLVEETSFLKSVARQILGAHRPFRAILMDPYGRPLLEFNRPWTLVNSKLSVTLPNPKTIAISHPSLPPGKAPPGLLTSDNASASSSTSRPPLNTLPLAATLGDAMPSVLNQVSFYDKLATRFRQPGSSDARPPPLLGQVYQVWHLWRRQYDLVKCHHVSGDGKLEEDQPLRQFGKIDGGFLTWDFSVQDRHGHSMALVSRHFTGFMRELFTDAGRYLVNFSGTIPLPQTTSTSNTAAVLGSAVVPVPSHSHTTLLSIEEKATILGAAMLIDFDYFSRHSNGVGGPSFFPFFFPWGGGTSDNAPPAPEAPTSTTAPTDTFSASETPNHIQQDNQVEDGNETGEGGSFWNSFFGDAEGEGEGEDGEDW